MRGNSSNVDGSIVFISGKRGSTHPVLVAWAPVGGELDLRDYVQATVKERMWVLGMASSTPSQVARFRAAQRKSGVYGYWFKRTDEFLRGACKFKDECMDWVSARPRSPRARNQSSGKRRAPTNAKAARRRAA
jgi:hypothetical protein